MNDGHVFTCDDLEAICRSAFSTKQRGQNIGYRGIGFKSTSGVAEEIAIYSGDLEVYFSRLKTKELFSSNSDVPLLRVPHWGSINDTISTRANELIDSATEQAEEKSIDKLLKKKALKKESGYKFIKLYNENKERYRYGKKTDKYIVSFFYKSY